jgi:hypothetical protein
MTRSLLTNPDALIRAAVAGADVRGEQDEMLRVEAQLPGFGGFFIDEAQRMVVYLKPIGRPSASVVRSILAREYGSRSEARVKEVMAHVAETPIIDGQYALSELIAIENNIAQNRDKIPGFSGTGVSLVRNRVKLGFVDASNMQAGMSAVASLGVPLAAVSPEVWGRMVGAQTAWGNSYRPVFGGLMIDFGNKSVDPDTTNSHLCSYGYTVTDALGHTYFMTAAHCENGFRSYNGATGDTIFQGARVLFAPIPIGTIVINPSWRIYPCPNADFCPIADVALGQFINGATGFRKVGTSQYEGLNGNPSPNSYLNGGTPYPVREPVEPEWVDTTANGIHKSGFVTGTTTGQIITPLTTGYVSYDWGFFGLKLAYYSNITRIEHMGWGGGDSGGPVFAGNGGAPYYSLGIVVAGGGHENAQKICDAGMQCVVIFVRWTLMETQLGIGHLNPATTQSPPGGLTSVSISGPQTINGCVAGTWTASPTGGTYPIRYSWDVENSSYNTDTSNQLTYTNTGTANAIFVTVTAVDANLSTASRQFKTGVGLPGSC